MILDTVDIYVIIIPWTFRVESIPFLDPFAREGLGLALIGINHRQHRLYTPQISVIEDGGVAMKFLAINWL